MSRVFNTQGGFPAPPSIPVWERDRIVRRVFRIITADWPPSRLLALVEAVCAGGLDRAVRVTGASRDECLAIWNGIYPAGYRGIDNQAALLGVLRDLAKGSDA